jgi:transcriptional regulator GlxA family with amidase domain
MRNVAIVIFDDAEVLDFCGPFEVFAVARGTQDERLFNVYTVAEEARPILARNGLSVNPTYTLENCPVPDLILVPGGLGSREAMRSERLLAWLNGHMPRVEQMLSVCTGALVLATSGLLVNLSATTYHTAFDLLQELSPSTTVIRGKRWVDNGKVITSAGVSAGIDMALYVVAKLHGIEQANRTARYMEYDHWQPEWFDAVPVVAI